MYPPAKLWRIGRGADPLSTPPPDPALLANSRAGNRFDSPSGNYRVLYFGSTLAACFGETLARLRPDTKLLSLVEDEWKHLGFMDVGHVPADWRHRRSAVQVSLAPDAPFVDVEATATREYLRAELATGLAALGHAELDISTVRGPDRRVTRMISEWTYNAVDDEGFARYQGIRYLSRLEDGWECWAVFDDAEITVNETLPITMGMPELVEVAELFGLRIF